jgi:uncharacterized membrane protein YozB (DUF420 family)
VTSSSRREWLIPTLLILLSAVPLAAGAVRVGELAGGAQITPGNARFLASPVPVVLHIISSGLYCVLGAFQFVPGIRRRRLGWHRTAGRLLVPLGLAAALSGLWMTVFYAIPEGDTGLLTVIRLVFGTAMALSLVLGLAAVRRRDIARHGAWMIRGYAIGLGAGTQVLTHLPWTLFIGAPDEFSRAMLMGAGWVVNVAVAEWVIRGRPAGSARPRPASRVEGTR